MFLIGLSINYMNSFILKLVSDKSLEIYVLLQSNDIICNNTVIWAVKALVLATPISNPAYVTKVIDEFLANIEVGTLTIERD